MTVVDARPAVYYCHLILFLFLCFYLFIVSLHFCLISFLYFYFDSLIYQKKNNGAKCFLYNLSDLLGVVISQGMTDFFVNVW